MQLSRKSTFIFSVAVAIVFLTVSCESKVSQCSKIINVVNQTGSENKTITDNGKKKEPEVILKTAENMEKAATQIEKLEIKDQKLKELQSSFVKLYKDTSKVSRDLVASLKKDDLENAESQLKKSRKNLTKENELISGITGYCKESK